MGVLTDFAGASAARRRATRPGPQRLGMLTIHQSKAPDRVFELRDVGTTIGRSRENDIVLDDPAVSRVHALIVRDERGDYWIRDQNSANGVSLNVNATALANGVDAGWVGGGGGDRAAG